ncbi:MAG: NADH-quinone oxidoreductase subunit H [Acidobacteria bacterium]|nr:NADH-quinone oxidoreductase subunit H [Acidobacteriota bacterium]
MVDTTGVIVEAVQALLALALAPGLIGFIRWMKARLQNRRGAPVWTPYFELRKLLRKETVVSANASWVFHVAPFVVFGSTVVVSLLVPVLVTPLPFNSVADLFAVVYLLLALFIVMLAETGRLPVDNPATHLELTMIHEAMILEYSGPYLALIEWASWLKLLVFLTLAGNLFVPWGLATSLAPAGLAIAAGTTLVKLVVLAVAVAVLETRVAKLRLFRVPELLAVSFVLGLLAVTSSFAMR